MNRLYKAIVDASVLGVLAAATASAGPVEDRKELMKSNGKSMKLSVQMVKGEIPYDAAAAAAAMQSIHEVPDKFIKLFPAGSDTHPETKASPKIWKDMKGFLEKAEDLKVASAKARDTANQGLEAFKAVLFGEVGKACKGCHDTYVIPKEKK